MKNLILLSIFAVFSLSISAQESDTKANSLVAEFMTKDGVLLQKDFYDIGVAAGVELQNIVITDVLSKEKIGAVRLTTTDVSYSSVSGISKTPYTGALDADEIDACIKSLVYMNDNVIKSIPTVYQEYEFRTRGGLSMGVYIGEKEVKKGTNEKVWKFFCQTKSYTDKSRSTAFAEENLGKLIPLLIQAHNQLKEKMQ